MGLIIAVAPIYAFVLDGILANLRNAHQLYFVIQFNNLYFMKSFEYATKKIEEVSARTCLESAFPPLFVSGKMFSLSALRVNTPPHLLLSAHKRYGKFPYPQNVS